MNTGFCSIVPVRGRISLVFILLLAISMKVWAVGNFVVKDIRVEGLQRISVGTVFTYLPIRVNDYFNADSSKEAVRSLFRTGFFKDVSLERDGGVLVVVVRERPAISAISLNGNDDIDTEALLSSLKEVGFAEGRVFKRAMLERVEQEMRQQYFSQGKYAVKIESTVTPLERNRVSIHIEVVEGQAAKIKHINIIGNTAFNDEVLQDNFELSEPTTFSFLTDVDDYSKQKLAADIETLRSYYLNRGYVKFSVTSTQVTISPDKRDIYVTINIKEGAKYHISSVTLAGELVVHAEELFPYVLINEGDVFSRSNIAKSIEKISAFLGTKGYAFANVNTIPEMDDDKAEIAVTLFIDPGKRVYVRRINMQGNTRTRDEVLRRELRQMEGAWFSADKVERSKVRIDRLGYFDSVSVEMPAVPGATDEVDVNYTVSERSSGNLSLGFGFSQSAGFLLNASVSQNNFLGSGKRVGFEFNNSQYNTVYSFSYLNPYYTVDGVSRGFGAYLRETNLSTISLSAYTTNSMGGNVSFGLPINEYDRINLDMSFENLEVIAGSGSPLEVTGFIAKHGGLFNTFRLNASWAHDTRNRRIFASRGMLQRASAEFTVPGIGLQYYKMTYRHLLYVPVTNDITLSLNGDVGVGNGYGTFDNMPFIKNFYAGGVRSVRGFQDYSLGPKNTPAPGWGATPYGGSFKVVGNAELIFPIPFFPEVRSFRVSAFLDAGNVYKDVSSFDAGEIRYSTGLSAIWLSPMGALQFSFANPLNDKPGDNVQVFQFTMGSAF
ncbi:MAG: outer membrane protein assembly factor BamA [Gammaproteobacteria bacterium]|nr:outer membrane protein assembly factor BamA [Gammaproteobacteria bacterium]